MHTFPEPIPLSLYVHIPWCLKKCPYCDFNSHAQRSQDTLPEQRYIDALFADLENELPRIWGRRLHSVFIGGGTPSLFSAEGIDQLLKGLRARLALRPDTEITLEANPGTFEQNKFAAFRQAGINRLSIGIQSFDNTLLRALGRVHDGDEAAGAVQIAVNAGFENINLDLMFGLPGQTPEQALQDLRTAIALAPTHLSYYQLTLEPNTLFHSAPPVLPDDEILWAMQNAGQTLLAQNGYQQYEVSAYAREQQHCQHNLNYWEFGDYLGIGAGAHGKLTHPAQAQIERRWKQRQPEAYMNACAQQQAAAGEHRLGEAETVFEFMLNALRLNAGFTTELFTQRTGLPLHSAEPTLTHAEQRGLIERTATHIRASELGRRFLDEITEMFLPEETSTS